MTKLNISLIILLSKYDKAAIAERNSLYNSLFNEIIYIVDSNVPIFEKNVFNYEFKDFSSQRNYGIEVARSEKILFIDEDEVLNIINIDAFKESLTSINDIRVGYFKYIEINSDENGTTNTRAMLKSHKFEGLVHENIYSDLIEYLEIDGAFLIHSGYSEKLLKKKAYRNLKLLAKENKNSKFVYYYLKECLSFGCAVNWSILPNIDVENYYMEALEMIFFNFKNDDCAHSYIKGLSSNPIIETLTYLKTNSGTPNKDYEKILRDKYNL